MFENALLAGSVPIVSGPTRADYELLVPKSSFIHVDDYETVEELDLMTRDAHPESALRDQKVGRIAIAYTVWSKKKGGGKLIVKEVFKKIKQSNHLNRLITLSPLTEMARNFHLHNGAFELQVNEKTQNFEYKI